MTAHGGTLLSPALLSVLQPYQIICSTHCSSLPQSHFTLKILLQKAPPGWGDCACLPSFRDKILRRKNHGVSPHVNIHNGDIGPSQGDLSTALSGLCSNISMRDRAQNMFTIFMKLLQRSICQIAIVPTVYYRHSPPQLH